MSSSIILRDVSKSFQLKHSFTIRQALSSRKTRHDPANIVQALDRVSFHVDQGAGLALMGMNGSGKSTLLKLVCGVMRPDSGTVHVRGKVAGLIDVGAGFHPELTCRENIYLNGAILGMSRSALDANLDAIVDFAGIERFLDTQVRFLSSGMFNRLGFSVAIHTEPDIFLVDEVLAVGDSQFKRKCRRALLARRKQHGLTLVIVAHELALLRKLCTDAVVLRSGQMIFHGPFEQAEHLVDEDDDE